MSEISAAMGLTLLESLDDVIEINHKHYEKYQQAFSTIEGVKMFSYNLSEKNNYQYIILEIDEEKIGISRDTVVKILHSENILARRYFYPGCHEMEPYRSYFPYASLSLANTNRLTRRVISLPTGTSVSDVDRTKICELISFIISNGSQITAKLAL
jgi:dTDP-4-amino-4,6-dideoxygalactose transaminase